MCEPDARRVGGVAERKIAASRPGYLIGGSVSARNNGAGTSSPVLQPRMTQWPAPRLSGQLPARAKLSGDPLATAWATFLGRVPWTHFWTLTFDPKRQFPVGEHVASREAFSWLNDGCRIMRARIAWLYATERGAGGMWHAHALTAGVSADVADHMETAWRLRNGYVKVQRVTDTTKAVLYTTKEAAKRGEVICADALVHYRNRLGDVELVALHPVD